MPSEFAGIEQSGGSEFGGIPMEAELPEQSFSAALKEFGRKINPVTMAQGLVQTTADLPGAAKAYGATNQKILSDAEDAYKHGDYAQAARHALGYVLNGIPGLGAALEEAGNKMEQGDYAGGLADTAALGTQIAVGAKAPAIARSVVPVAKAAGAGVSAAAPDIGVGAAKIAAGEALGKVPGMEWPARFTFGWPGARQIGKGLTKGGEAFKESLRGAPPGAPLTVSASPAEAPASAPIQPPPLPDSVMQELLRESGPPEAPPSPAVPSTTIQPGGRPLRPPWATPPAERPAVPPEPAQPGAQPSPAPPGGALYHGSPRELTTLQPGSMLTNSPVWASGYTTKIAPDLSESFSGKIHSAEIPPGKTYSASSLHDAEDLLLGLAKDTGQPYSSLKDAAEVVAKEHGISAIIAKDQSGNVTGAIILKPANVSGTLDPVSVLKQAKIAGQPIPSNLEKPLAEAPAASPAPPGQTISYEAYPTERGIEVQARLPNGDPVGIASFISQGEAGLKPNDVTVYPEYRRQGIASALYDKAQSEWTRIKGKPAAILEDTVQTPEGAAFRKAYDQRSAPQPEATASPAATQSPQEFYQGAAREVLSAPTAAAAAKSARYADAISKWAKDHGMPPTMIAEQWGKTTPEIRGSIILEMKRKGYLEAHETIPNTSAAGIVAALKSRTATIKPPPGFSMGEMKNYRAP